MFRNIINLLESIELMEGGNIWKDNLATKRIDRADVVPTVQFLEKITGLNLSDNLLGSTGIKDSSGDLDIAVDANKYDKNALQAKLDNWAKSNDKTALTKKTGVSVHFRTPIKGDSKNGYIQTDFMFLNDVPFAKWSMRAPASFFKGAHKHIVMASVAKPLGLKWSFATGLTDRNTGEPVKGGKDPNEVAKALFGPKANAETISTVENMLAALNDDPNREQKLADARTVIGDELAAYEKQQGLNEDEGDKTLSREHLESVLKNNGYEDLKIQGNKINALVQIPEGNVAKEFRMAIMQEILGILQSELPEYNPQYSKDTSLSSLGGLVFANSPLKVVVKDTGKQGDKSAGVANEIELASMIESVIQRYGTADVTFTDERGVKLTIENADRVEVAGRDTKGRKKADVLIVSPNSRLPISIKKVNADMWESADSLVGKRAREIIDKLVEEGVVELIPVGERKGQTVYKLSKEIVMEPTEEEAMQTIFGSDINPEGGIVIQTFKPEHFRQNENKVDVDAYAVIVEADDIPESHVMQWLLRNDSSRNSATLGIPGIRPLGVTLQRGLGKKGEKDVIYVDSEGNVLKGKAKEKGNEEPKLDVTKTHPLLKRRKEEKTKDFFDVGREKRN
jgi:hypothetical protein